MSNDSPTAATAAGRRRDGGFTLVEILIAIVLVGILSAVVVVGVSNLTEKGSASACSASLDASKAGSMVYFTSTGRFPATFDDMLNLVPPALTLPAGQAHTPTSVTANGGGWVLTLVPGTATVAPTFTCTAPSMPSGTAACPGVYAGWVGEYYDNRTLTGQPALCRDDANISFFWGGGSVAAGRPGDTFSARWTRTATFTGGAHTFTLGSDDGARLYIDGTLVSDYWYDRGYTTNSQTRTLTAGTHTIVVEFYENGGAAAATLTWT